MFVCNGYNGTLFRCDLNDKYYLTHKFRNITSSDGINNCPVDFAESGLCKKDCIDIWNSQITLSVSTDEATPCKIKDIWMGANHGHPCAITIYCKNHNKTVKDIGSVWKDQLGIMFTLVKIPNIHALTFVSDNLSESINDYTFAQKITGTLTYVKNGKNRSTVAIEEQKVGFLLPSIRHLQKTLYAITNGQKKIVTSSTECDFAEIHEDYYIINPATVCRHLQKKRPCGGYKTAPNLANFGDPMILHKIIYRILPDGTILSDFEVVKLMDIDFRLYLGAMYQEKKDCFGGGIYRCVPNSLPFEKDGVIYDFANLYRVTENNFPNEYYLDKDHWANQNCPPDRVVDYFKDLQGNNSLGFACGFLPLYDGHPDIRKNIEHAINIGRTRKAYPTFKQGKLSNVKGIAYKKFFETDTNKNSCYKVEYFDRKYIYFDFSESSCVQTKIEGTIIPLNISSAVEYTIQDDVLQVNYKGNSPAFAVFEQTRN